MTKPKEKHSQCLEGLNNHFVSFVVKLFSRINSVLTYDPQFCFFAPVVYGRLFLLKGSSSSPQSQSACFVTNPFFFFQILTNRAQLIMILTHPFKKNPKSIFCFYPTVVAVVGSHDIDLPGLLT